ncbi:MAG: polyphosphate polymerase domain-containing protein [Bacillota bacterium]|nr:polyphosphate polymerase domain-containing protein [Bacillota bacterium]
MEQMRFARHETKYIVTAEQKALIEEILKTRMQQDRHGRSTIQSLYYDTPDFRLIRRSIEHPLYKEKIRIRSYGPAGSGDKVFLELKKKYRKVVYKRRMTLTAEQAAAFMAGSLVAAPEISSTYCERQIAREIAYARDYYKTLQPAMLISYEREAWQGCEDPGLRVTFDSNILWRDFDLTLASGGYGQPIMNHCAHVMEIKTSSGIPLWLTEILDQERIYKTSFSKYGKAFAQKASEIMEMRRSA